MKKMAAIPYMPLYVADYMADAGHLSTTEHGAYLLLIMNYWQRGSAFRAPDQRALNVRLANVVRMSSSEWVRSGPVLAEFFQISLEDGVTWSHKRIESELSKFRAKSLQAKEAGLASAQRRLNGRSTGVQRAVNHTDTDTDTDKNKQKPSAPIPVRGVDDLVSASAEKLRKRRDAEAWFESEFWPLWPVKKNKKPAKDVAWKIPVEKRPIVIAAVRRQASQIAAMDRPIHAATWINAERWEDVDHPSQGRFGETERLYPETKFDANHNLLRKNSHGEWGPA